MQVVFNREPRVASPAFAILNEAIPECREDLSFRVPTGSLRGVPIGLVVWHVLEGVGQAARLELLLPLNRRSAFVGTHPRLAAAPQSATNRAIGLPRSTSWRNSCGLALNTWS